MDAKEINKVIEEIKEHTSADQVENPDSYLPVLAKNAVAVLEDMKRA